MSLFSRLHFPVMQLRVVLFFFFLKKCDFQSLFAPAAVLNKKCLCACECAPTPVLYTQL